MSQLRNFLVMFAAGLALWVGGMVLSLLLVGLALPPKPVAAQYSWQKYDAFDKIQSQIDSVQADNCKVVNINDLFLPPGTVTHVPDLQWLGIDPVFPNRTNLLHVHNMALSRAFYLSFILQKASDDVEPGFMYYYLSTIADVAANRFINASSFYFAPHMSFTPSYKGFFNKTLPLFAPRACRSDDFNDPYHLQKTSTLNTIEAFDFGAIPNNSASMNYTNEQYRINEWYNAWLPDQTKRHDSKTTYTAHITYRNGTNETFVWHGPPAPSDPPGPIKWFRPYFDCGRTNKWLYGASVPVPDIFPRHTGWRHIEIPMYVAVAVMEIDFDRLDINQCPLGEGNPAPNFFADTARCRNQTTQCEPVHGYGFRRGGYQCRCKPGYRLPQVQRTAFKGESIERATLHEYNNHYACEKIGYIAVRTQNVLPIDPLERIKMMNKIETLTGLKPNQTRTTPRLDPLTITNFMRSVRADNCQRLRPDDLVLAGSVAYGKEIQMENQARMAVRLANFLSAFLQIVDPNESFAEFRVTDKPLTKDQVIGEALAAIIGDRQLQGLGVVFEPSKFNENETYFGPYAYRRARNDRSFFVDDVTRFDKDSPYNYQNRDFFKQVGVRWRSNVNEEELETYTTKINIRFNKDGYTSIRYDHYPLQYRAADIRHGSWSTPYFDCGGFHNKWLLGFGVPFFGWDAIKSGLEFRGVVFVNMRVEDMDINQCGSMGPDGSDSAASSASIFNTWHSEPVQAQAVDSFPLHRYSYQPNAFRNTHKCDRLSSRCVPILGRRFDAGGYKCECEQGFEYPFNDEFTYFDGQILEAEYQNMRERKGSRFDTLACRVAGAMPLALASGPVLVAVLLLSSIYQFLI